MSSPQLTIDVISDTVCPWCYIGKRKLERALETLREEDGVEAVVRWHPFLLDPRVPEMGMEMAEYLARKFGGIGRIDAILSRIVQFGAEVGIDFAFDTITRRPNSVASHQLIRWAADAGVQDAIVTDTFASYFEQAHDIGDVEVLVEIATRHGMDEERVRVGLGTGEDADQVLAESRTAARRGISGVPCFIIGESFTISGAQDPGLMVTIMRKMLEKA